MSDTLTIDMLRDAMAAIKALGPVPRLIVGFPGVADDKAYEYTPKRITLVGRSLWARVEAQAVKVEGLPGLGAMPIEFFDSKRRDHLALFREVWDAWLSGIVAARSPRAGNGP